MSEFPRFYSPQAETLVGHNRLPHWDQQGRIYSLTWRLADAIPAHIARGLREEEMRWRDHHPEPWSHEVEKDYLHRFAGRIERLLDLGHGDCVLRRPECSRIVEDALRFFEGKRTCLHSWVVMPNHVHAMAEIMEGHGISDVMESWKGFTARAVNASLGRAGTLWQKGYFDRLVRDWEHFGNVVRYFRGNPTKAGLRAGEFRAGESELARNF